MGFAFPSKKLAVALCRWPNQGPSPWGTWVHAWAGWDPCFFFFFSGRPGGFGGSRRANKYQDPTAEGKIHSTQSDVRRVPGPLRGSQAQTDAMIAAPDEPFPVLLGGRVSGDVSDVAKRILSFDFCRLIVGAAGW